VKDFVTDCKDLLYSFFYDPCRSARLVDRLEEDLIHHASLLSRCNSLNVAFKLGTHISALDLLSKHSLNSDYYTIRGTFAVLALTFLFRF